MPSDPYPWCRRIFASVDLIGSTAFKARDSENSINWAYIFKQFFDEFPTTLRAQYDKLPQVADGRPDKQLKVWKFVGDEILFEASLTRHEESVYHILAFKAALNAYAAQFQQKSTLSTLGLKGTIWGAGFPVSNAEVKTKVEGAELADFVGPCIDQGFRLCATADARRIPLSADIVYMLAMTPVTGGTRLAIHCGEPAMHKGVPAPYPSFWLDRLDAWPSAEDAILARRGPADPQQLKNYLEELFSRTPNPVQRPFVVSDPSVHFNVVPKHMDDRRNEILAGAAEKTYTDAEPRASQATPQPLPAPRSAAEEGTAPAAGGV